MELALPNPRVTVRPRPVPSTRAEGAQSFVFLRLDRARQLLSMTELSVSEIACAAGFGTSSQLSRRFKHRFSYSPHQHRLLRDTSTTEVRDNRPNPATQQGDSSC